MIIFDSAIFDSLVFDPNDPPVVQLPPQIGASTLGLADSGAGAGISFSTPSITTTAGAGSVIFVLTVGCSLTSDSKGNSYTQLQRSNAISGSGNTYEGLYAVSNGLGGSAHNWTAVVDANIPNTVASISVVEVLGGDTTSPLGGSIPWYDNALATVSTIVSSQATIPTNALAISATVSYATADPVNFTRNDGAIPVVSQTEGINHYVSQIAYKVLATGGSYTSSASISTTPDKGTALIAWVVAPSQVLTPRRALTISSGVLRQVSSAELGTGVKPLVYASQQRKLRATTEGTPIILVNGTLRLLLATESLEI